jgi:hypothetical protein
MSKSALLRDDIDPVAEIAAALKRAGLRVTDAEIANMVEDYLVVRRGLEALRHRLPKTTEPPLTFDSSAPYRPSGDGDNDVGR